MLTVPYDLEASIKYYFKNRKQKIFLSKNIF